MAAPRSALLAGAPHVVSVGLDLFAATLAQLRVPVVHVEWRPPAGGDLRLAMLLARVSDDAGGESEATSQRG